MMVERQMNILREQSKVLKKKEIHKEWHMKWHMKWQKKTKQKTNKQQPTIGSYKSKDIGERSHSEYTKKGSSNTN